MNRASFGAAQQTRLVRNPEGAWSFVPPPLPPALAASWELLGSVTRAERSLSELVGVARTLPNPHLLIGPFVRKEAVLSSKIEGTQTSFSELVLFEAGGQPGSPLSDVYEVANYINALNYGLRRLADIPVSLRLVKEIHAELMRGVRGQNLAPGEFRKSQVFIGAPGGRIEEATYVPPPPGPEMLECLHDLEAYIHDESPDRFPELIRLAVVHYQFEAIHPFMDGNGRIGRLLLTLLLCNWGLLAQPLLYLSAYFEKHRAEYYRLLMEVSQQGAWEAWIRFFLRGVEEQSQDAVKCAHRLLDLWRAYREALQAGGASGRALQLVDSLFSRPVTTIPQVGKDLDLTYRGAQLVVGRLVDQGILQEVPESFRQRSKMFWAPQLMDVMMDTLEEGEEESH